LVGCLKGDFETFRMRIIKQRFGNPAASVPSRGLGKVKQIQAWLALVVATALYGCSGEYAEQDAAKETVRNAVVAGDAMELEKMLAKNPLLSSVSLDDEGNSALHIAVLTHQEPLVKLLLVKGVPTEIRNRAAETALHLAAKLGSGGIASMLTDEHAKLNARTLMGSTPLHLASAEGHLTVISLLLSKGVKLVAS